MCHAARSLERQWRRTRVSELSTVRAQIFTGLDRSATGFALPRTQGPPSSIVASNAAPTIQEGTFMAPLCDREPQSSANRLGTADRGAGALPPHNNPASLGTP